MSQVDAWILYACPISSRTESLNDVEDDTGLYGSEARFGSLQLPGAFCFGKKAIMGGMRIQILGPVREAWVAGLTPNQTEPLQGT